MINIFKKKIFYTKEINLIRCITKLMNIKFHLILGKYVKTEIKIEIFKKIVNLPL